MPAGAFFAALVVINVSSRITTRYQFDRRVKSQHNKTSEKGSKPVRNPLVPLARMPGVRADSGRKLQVDSESGGNSDSDSARDSDSEAAGAADASARPQTRGTSKLHLICTGCNKLFANRTSLRQHGNAWKTADPACRNAATKRPRTVRRGVDSAAARDTEDRIQRMVGDRSNRGQAASDAQSPFLQPRDEVLGPAWVTVTVQLGPTGLHNVCIRFVPSLSMVCTWFA